MSSPRIAWHPCSQYVFCSSDNACVYAWSVTTEAVAGRLACHGGKVRDVAVWPGAGGGPTLLLTGSFDKTAQAWDVTAA
jgi:WD40 repeat protein